MPGPTSDTTSPASVQTPALAGSTAKVTGSPELAVAATVYAAPPTAAPAGGVDVKSIDCTLSEGAATENDCCTRAAAW